MLLIFSAFKNWHCYSNVKVFLKDWIGFHFGISLIFIKLLLQNSGFFFGKFISRFKSQDISTSPNLYRSLYHMNWTYFWFNRKYIIIENFSIRFQPNWKSLQNFMNTSIFVLCTTQFISTLYITCSIGEVVINNFIFLDFPIFFSMCNPFFTLC